MIHPFIGKAQCDFNEMNRTIGRTHQSEGSPPSNTSEFVLEQVQSLQCAVGNSNTGSGRQRVVPRVNTDDTGAMSLTELPHGWYGSASTEFDDNGAFNGLEPGCKPSLLPDSVVLDPLPVSKHQNVWPRETTAMRTPRHLAFEQTGRLVDDGHEIVCRPGLIGTSLDALKPVDGSMAFHNAFCIKSSLLELTVDVAGEDESAVFHCRRPPKQNVEARMRHGCAIEREPVPIKPPAQARIA